MISNCKHFSILIFIMLVSQFQASAIPKKFLLDLRISNKNALNYDLHKMIIELPSFLKDIPQESQLMVITPDILEGVGPLEDAAFFIEGARTALAWLKSHESFFKEHDIHLQIIKASEYHFHEEANSLYILGSLKRSLPFKKIIDIPWNSAVPHGKKRYLITGGAGFIASHLSLKLLQEGNQVIVLDNLSCSTGENLKELMKYPNFYFVKHDVTRPFEVTAKLDAVVHCASIPSPAFYYAMPLETMAVGLQGTLNTLEVCMQHNARYLFTSTSEVYGDPEIHPQPESYAGNVECMGARSAYDQSKRGAETLIKLYYELYHIDVRIARIFNTYGPGMRLKDGRVITNFIDALLNNKPLTIYGDGNQTRSFCYVDDTVDGIYRLLTIDEPALENSIERRVFNIGNPEEYSINDIIGEFQRLAQNYLHHDCAYQKIDQFDKTDPRKRKPDITKAHTILGFTPKVSFREGLEKTFLYFLGVCG